MSRSLSRSAKSIPTVFHLSGLLHGTHAYPRLRSVRRLLQEKAKSLKGDTAPIVEHDGLTHSRQDNAKLAAMTKSLDASVGRLLDALDSRGLDENTVIVFTSDNGGLTTKATPGPASVLPLRAGKGWCYEGGIRVPLIIRAPGISQPGHVSKELAISMDFFPTILDLASIQKMPRVHRDGISLMEAIKGRHLNRDTLYWHYPHYHGSTWTPGSAIRSGDWKAIQFYHHEKAELYNLNPILAKPTTFLNLAREAPRASQQTRRAAETFQSETA